MSAQALQTLSLVSRIFFSICLFGLGLWFLIAGQLKIRDYFVRGVVVRVIGAIFLVASMFFFLHESRGFFHNYGLLVQALLLLAGIILLWILAKKPAPATRLPAGTHTLQSQTDEPNYRLHLRLNKDGSGILVVNAATILHLNPSAAEFAFHMMKGTSVDDVAGDLAARYRIGRDVVKRDFTGFRDRIQTLIHTPDLDPVSYLDMERVAPHSQDLTAPLRLDCALTYRLPADSRVEYAPVRRVDRELTTAEWFSIMDKAWTAGIPHITFTGGEPTLREDLPALISHAEKNGQVCGLLSAGSKLGDKKYLQELLQTGLDHLLFILQPDDQNSWNALELIMPEDLFVTVHLTITPDNISSAEDVLRRLGKLGAKSLSLSASDPVLQERMVSIRNKAADLGITLRWDLPVPYSLENPVTVEVVDDAVPEGAGKVWLYVEPDGDVLPAQGEADKILGNFLKDPWEKICKK